MKIVKPMKTAATNSWPNSDDHLDLLFVLVATVGPHRWQVEWVGCFGLELGMCYYILNFIPKI